MRQVIMMLAALVLLGGCATGPRYDTQQVELELLPSQVSEDPESYRGGRVLWGGTIVVTRNLPEYTEIEVLGYPLDGSQRPQTGREPAGRFLVRQPGYLEEMKYARGRMITVTGELTEAAAGQVGEARYTYPVVEPEDLYLWSPTSREPARPRFHFGIGVIFGR